MAPCDGTGTSVAALVEHYNGMGSTSADGLHAVEELIGWIPERGGVANIGLNRAVPFPTTVTHYVSTGAVWERTVAIQDAQYGGEYGRLYAPRRTYAGGSTTHDTWFGGPIGSRVSPLTRSPTGPAADARGQRAVPVEGAFTDAAGHLANSDIFSAEYSGKIYADDVLEHDIFASVFMNTTIPAGDHRHPGGHRHPAREPVLAAVDRGHDRVGVRRPTSRRTSCEVLPMLGIDYGCRCRRPTRPRRASTTSPSGSRCRTPSRLLPVVKRSIDVSWDGGQTWTSGRDPVRRHLLQGPGAQRGRRTRQPARLGHGRRRAAR